MRDCENKVDIVKEKNNIMLRKIYIKSGKVKRLVRECVVCYYRIKWIVCVSWKDHLSSELLIY